VQALTKFWRKLRPKQLGPDFLASLSYTILGLGDSNYNQFCNGPKNVHRRLSELGRKTKKIIWFFPSSLTVFDA
jgi:sulfite reductase alpha subunit-like flavoprotein